MTWAAVQPRFITDEARDRAAELRQSLQACCCQIFGRARCAPCEAEEAELAAIDPEA